MKRTYNVVLEQSQIEYILNLLSFQPFNEVVEIIMELGKQLKDQQRDGDN